MLTKPLTLKLYYSKSCGHCRRIDKTIDKIAKERCHVKVEKIEHAPSLSSEIKFIPTVVVMYDEKELGRFSSALAKKAIDSWLDQLEDYIKTYLMEV
ncbi:putative thioredoxin [Brevibacillus phage SecTim467]|uniref:Thioredoxin domain-containing protein n=2 Tax=Jenstvirus jenst TaxID=1982225 RepID=A0A0K2CNQ8_9CAUD|nr:hypothetical protein AVV11_gp121 [Brevibacillus phage Jenst]ALA07199.1 hypothetical protein JENST_70 [Brevibacillus phage Jenst]ALA07420.1 putative thioredoxin [Brevibacillus phage SecTim467]